LLVFAIIAFYGIGGILVFWSFAIVAGEGIGRIMGRWFLPSSLFTA
jgi:hypothetical protein